MIEKEIWKDIIGYKGIYKVSNYGNIKSLERKQIRKGYTTKKGKLIKSYETIIPESFLVGVDNGTGYLQVNLTKNKKCKKFYIHRIVYFSFNNISLDKKIKLDVDHIDNDKKNNYLSNLQLMTHKENIYKLYNLDIDSHIIYSQSFKCIDCNKQIRPKSKRCNSCRIYNDYKKNHNNYEKLYKEYLKNPNYTKLGKKYGISDNSIKKRIKTYLKYKNGPII